ncbi:MAG: hypothetical protein M0Z66_02255 [Thermaerobacter sp.]|nr:hypothetical protein [Thermaerobacter sp.]
MSRNVDWIGPVKRPADGPQTRVERHPARAGERFGPLSKPIAQPALGVEFRLDRLPYLLALDGVKPLVALPLALHEDDLLLLGFGLFPELCESRIGTALVVEGLHIARETGRRRLVAPVTNADLLALFFLQTQGFSLEAMRPYAGPPHSGTAGIPAMQELVLARIVD